MDRKAEWFAIKAEVLESSADHFVFSAAKTMYGGKAIKAGDPIFIFASEHEGGSGLLARGIVINCKDVPRTDAARQTPRVSIAIERTATVKLPLGRAELRTFRGRSEIAPEVELDFKLYRQAANKIVGLTGAAGEFLNTRF